ncbi:MAG TPA: hypothetical protein VKU60_10230 [Chloroflexota bacterium]|nr:hypothetical protein [Chloroflexota bacterium]
MLAALVRDIDEAQPKRQLTLRDGAEEGKKSAEAQSNGELDCRRYG